MDLIIGRGSGITSFCGCTMYNSSSKKLIIIIFMCIMWDGSYDFLALQLICLEIFMLTLQFLWNSSIVSFCTCPELFLDVSNHNLRPMSSPTPWTCPPYLFILIAYTNISCHGSETNKPSRADITNKSYITW